MKTNKPMTIAAGAASAAALTLALAPAAAADGILDGLAVHYDEASHLAVSSDEDDAEVTMKADEGEFCQGPFLLEGEIDPADPDVDLLSGDDAEDADSAVVISGDSDPGTHKSSPRKETFKDLDSDQSYTVLSRCTDGPDEFGEVNPEMDVYLSAIGYDFDTDGLDDSGDADGSGDESGLGNLSDSLGSLTGSLGSSDS